MTEVEKKGIGYKKLITGIIIVAVILAVLFIPMIPTSEAYNVTEPYEREATYVVDDWDLVETTIIHERVVTKHRTVYKSIIELLIYG